MGSPHTEQPFRLCGLLCRRPRWGLSGRGYIVLVTTAAIGAVFLLLTIHSFLAVTDRVPTDLLVIEGWINDTAIRAAVDEFRSAPYVRIITTGGPVHGAGKYTNDYNTSANVGADRVKRAGVPPDRIKIVASRAVDRDRTYQSAVALRNWLNQNEPSIRAFNIATESVHARRTRLLFEKAFPEEMKIGIVAIPNPDYDANRWWQYSEGVREILGETIAYLYARFLFHP